LANQPVLENLRLHELRFIVRQCEPYFHEFCSLLGTHGYQTIQEFVTEQDDAKALAAITDYFSRAFAADLFNGVGAEYSDAKAKWYFLSWLFRDAPAQRLDPLINSVAGATRSQRKVNLLNLIRKDVAELFTDDANWAWPAISEVMLTRLEGSRRALKGGVVENVVRAVLRQVFETNNAAITISDKETRIADETYDIVLTGGAGRILCPVKTRETMGGGHASLFTRDIHKSITVATDAGEVCIPIVIAESWAGDLASLPCEHFVYVARNPNQLDVIQKELAERFTVLLPVFKSLN
jgi:hypothetical protein